MLIFISAIFKKMLKHAAKTSLDLERLPPEKRVSLAGVTFRRRSSTFIPPKVNLRRSNSLSWPSSRNLEESKVKELTLIDYVRKINKCHWLSTK